MMKIIKQIKGENVCKKEIEYVLEKLRAQDSNKVNFIKYKIPENIQGFFYVIFYIKKLVLEAGMEETIQSSFSVKNVISKTGGYQHPFKLKTKK